MQQQGVPAIFLDTYWILCPEVSGFLPGSF